MTLRKNSAEGYVNGDTVAPSTSGAASGDSINAVVGAGTVVASSARPARGSIGYRANIASGVVAGLSFSGMNSTTMASRAYFGFGAVPTVAHDLMQIRSTSSNSCKLQVNTVQHLAVSNAAGVLISTFSGLTLDTTTTYRLELFSSIGTTTSNGRIRAAVYVGDSTTPADTVFDSSTENAGTANLTEARYGKLTTTGAADFYFDDIAVNDGASGFIGPNSSSTYGPYIWNGTTFVHHIPHVYSGTAWIAYN